MDTTSLQRLRGLYEQQQGSSDSDSSARTAASATAGQPQPCAAIVYIPAHKSHLDYLMLRRAQFSPVLLPACSALPAPPHGLCLTFCGL